MRPAFKEALLNSSDGSVATPTRSSKIMIAAIAPHPFMSGFAETLVE
jgi:hypothetical protein